MKSIASVVVVAVFFAVSVSSRGLKFHVCTKSGIECLDKKSYIFCKEASQIVIEQWGLKKCPRHHVCQEDGSIWFPCVDEDEISDESNESDKSGTPERDTVGPHKPPIQFHKCTKKGFECLNKNTFVYCPKSSKLILGQLFGKKCPPRFVCQDGTFGWYPCVSESVTDADNSRRSTESQKKQTTTEESASQFGSQTTTELKSSTLKESTTTLKTSVKSSIQYDTTFALPKESTIEDIDTEETTTEEKKFDTENDVITEQSTSRTGAKSSIQYDTTFALPKESTIEDIDIEETTTEEKKSGTENDVITESTGRISSDLPSTELPKTTVDDRKIQTKETKFRENVPYSTSPAVIIPETEIIPVKNAVVPAELFVLPAGLQESAVLHINQAAPPNCYSAGVFPGPNCQQYYECVSYFWFFYHPELKTCPTGESFSIVESRCVPSAETDCID